jgi:hypothetical protein
MRQRTSTISWPQLLKAARSVANEIVLIIADAHAA